MSVPDVPAAQVLGGAQRLLAERLRSGRGDDLAGVQDTVAGLGRQLPLSPCCASLAQARTRGWSASADLDPTERFPPGPLPPGRPLLSSSQVAENHRQRIVFAATKLCNRDGYSALTISEILRSSGVDARVFHALFRDKADVLMAGCTRCISSA